jgi:putative nucleotidyltransferase with HDIG domain
MSERRAGKAGGGAAGARGVRGAGKSRRSEIRRRVPRQGQGALASLRRPSTYQSILLAGAFALLAGAIVSWARERPLVSPGRIMTETREVRVDFEVPDMEATESRRQVARSSAPRVYRVNAGTLQEIQSSLERLPTALADAETLEDVAPEIRSSFNLTAERLEAIRDFAIGGEASRSWERRVRTLLDELRLIAAVDQQTFQREQQQANAEIILEGEDDEGRRVPKDRLLNVQSRKYTDAIEGAVVDADFRGLVKDLVVEQLLSQRRPTYDFDQTASELIAAERMEQIEPVMVRHPEGRTIYRRGDRLDEDQYALLMNERRAFRSQAGGWTVWGPRVAALGVAALVALMMGGYASMFCQRLARNPLRVLALGLLLTGALGAAALGAAASPGLTTLFAAAAVTFVAVILVVAYDQRTAGALSVLFAALLMVALKGTPGLFVAAAAGVGAAVWRLGEIRQRDTLIRAGVAIGATLLVATLAVEALRLPPTFEALRQAVGDAALAGLGGLLVGFVALGLLPSIERVFDITTGMTLIELRDPNQPLLRELQRRAPGTYSHSLTVASLAENAANAIGADALHVYVGALYHDVGKMNKPDYFVENQAGGHNRHARLRPAMSLLVIVGHVKDGVELAREYGIPRGLHHYIESHHGTTLVEYFYHAAQQKAEGEEEKGPAEIEYRYPGPKPRTKEAAILMLCDSVESATRAMSEPSPRRIEALVDKIATKRLLDGQFDECDLTLRELHVIEDSLIKQLNSIYHGRISYPSDEAKGGAEAPGGVEAEPVESEERTAAESA